jgi:hypothetical protein
MGSVGGAEPGDAALGPDGPARGEVALLHGVMALSDTWWRIGRRWRRVAGTWRRSTFRGTEATCAATERSISTARRGGVAARLDGPVDLMVGHSLGRSSRPSCSCATGRRRGRVKTAGPGAIDLGAGGHHRARRGRGAPRPGPAGRPRARGQSALGPWRSTLGTGHREADSDAVVAALNGPLRWDLAGLLTVDVPTFVLAAPDASKTSRWTPARPCAAPTRGRTGRARARALRGPRGGHCLHRDDPARWLEVVDACGRGALGAEERQLGLALAAQDPRSTSTRDRAARPARACGLTVWAAKTRDSRIAGSRRMRSR